MKKPSTDSVRLGLSRTLGAMCSLARSSGVMLALMVGFASMPAHAQLGPRVFPPEQRKVEPSLEETTAWITRKVDEMPNRTSPTRSGRSYFVGFNHCDMSVVTVDFQNDGKLQILDNVWVPKQAITQDKVSLVDVDVEKISASKAYSSEEGSVTIGSPSEPVMSTEIFGPADGSRGVDDYRKLTLEKLEDKIKYMFGRGMTGRTLGDVWKWGELVSSKSTKYTWLRTPDLDSAYHLADAVKHAATLCQREKAESLKMKPKKPGDLF